MYVSSLNSSYMHSSSVESLYLHRFGGQVTSLGVLVVLSDVDPFKKLRSTISY